MNLLISILLTLGTVVNTFAVDPDKKNLPIHKTAVEKLIPVLPSAAMESRAMPPEGPVRALGEWEQSDGLMILWTNKDLIKKVADRSKAFLIGDDNSGINWWKRFVANNGINKDNVSYLKAPTNSMWIRDYGPWFVIDGQGEVGLVDTVYNRPRPLDDVAPEYFADSWNLPLYKLNLVHTGGNYYADGHGKAFSSTLVYSENPNMSKLEVNKQMDRFLGVKDYITSRLVPRLTIEHFDTFGKLVAPDTLIWSEFPKGTPYTKDSEDYLKKLKRLKSPYGTPYKIYRMKMIPRRPGSNTQHDFRAYINSVVHNKFVFVASYGDEHDEEAKRVYEAALPGYEVVLVDAKSTKWGDSVHCRTRNKHTSEANFMFPNVKLDGNKLKLNVDIVRTFRDSSVLKNLKVHWRFSDEEKFKTESISKSGNAFEWIKDINENRKGLWIHLYVELSDSAGRVKTKPMGAPLQTIDFLI